AIAPAVGWLPGDSVAISWTTRNQGTGAATGSWDETVRIRNLTNGQTLFTVHLPFTGSIAAGDGVARGTTVTWPLASLGTGRIEFTVTTDPAGEVFENNAGGTAETN